MSAAPRPRPVAIIGAGLSGTIAAVQLLAALPPERGVLLCERAERFGRGIAYATAGPDHLLNVRAANMSAFPDQPGHFADWLRARDSTSGEAPGDAADPALRFARRGLYGRYLADVLGQALTRTDGAPRLTPVHDAVADLVPESGGFSLRMAGGRTYAVAGVVLALGNLRPAPTADGVTFPDPWDPAVLEGLHPDLPVLVVGTGLTMVDLALALTRRVPGLSVVALSRRGLLPHSHAAVQARALPDLGADAATPRALLRRLRAEIAAGAGDWRGVIDGLRPATQGIWQAWSPAERRRFLRHLRPYWDVHRHRMAPSVAQAMAALVAERRLRPMQGRLEALEIEGEGRAAAVLRLRGQAAPIRLPVQRVIEARGVQDAARADDPLVRRLIARGLVRPDALGIGLDARADLALLDAPGLPAERLWGLGPIVRGVFWECTAVPDIRVQAAGLAQRVATVVTGLS